MSGQCGFALQGRSGRVQCRAARRSLEYFYCMYLHRCRLACTGLRVLLTCSSAAKTCNTHDRGSCEHACKATGRSCTLVSHTERSSTPIACKLIRNLIYMTACGTDKSGECAASAQIPLRATQADETTLYPNKSQRPVTLVRSNLGREANN